MASSSPVYSIQTHKRIIDALSTGLFPETAAASAGMRKSQLEAWLVAGAQGQPGFIDFHKEFLETSARIEHEWVERFQAHFKFNWQAIAWMLERRFPARWSLQERLRSIGIDESLAEKTTEEQVDGKPRIYLPKPTPLHIAPASKASGE